MNKKINKSKLMKENFVKSSKKIEKNPKMKIGKKNTLFKKHFENFGKNNFCEDKNKKNKIKKYFFNKNIIKKKTLNYFKNSYDSSLENKSIDGYKIILNKKKRRSYFKKRERSYLKIKSNFYKKNKSLNNKKKFLF